MKNSSEHNERLGIGPLTSKEREQMSSVIDEAKQLQAELLSRRSGKPFPSSTTILGDPRKKRTAGMMKSYEPPLTAEELRDVAEEAIAEGAVERMGG